VSRVAVASGTSSVAEEVITWGPRDHVQFPRKTRSSIAGPRASCGYTPHAPADLPLWRHRQVSVANPFEDLTANYSWNYSWRTSTASPKRARTRPRAYPTNPSQSGYVQPSI
jgi:hypothetical protein